MARVLEDDAKRLLASAGLRVPEFERASSAEAACSIASSFGGRAVVKALVPTGRRGKAGAVRLCAASLEAEVAASELIGSVVGPYPVDMVLVEEWVDIERELYLAFEIARGRPEYTLLMSADGGVEIESRPESVSRVPLDPIQLPSESDLAQLWDHLGLGALSLELGRVTHAALRLFIERDLTLLEINPLSVLPDGNVSCVGALMAIDDNALARQPDVAKVAIEGSERAWRPETVLEERVTSINADTSQRGSARYLELENGNIGFLCGGGGASLLLFDALVAAGGSPANYSEFGGNPTEQRVYDLTRVVLDKRGVQGLFVGHNLTNNTQVDVVAAGITRALQDAALAEPFPVIAREAGLHDKEGRRIFEEANVTYVGEETTLNAAADAMVDAMRKAGLV
ncbi:MAG: succinate--CoA ligase [Chloroflexia bacterium]|nr:succinate--CoA ligase [Chloroflexia bacterium]